MRRGSRAAPAAAQEELALAPSPAVAPPGVAALAAQLAAAVAALPLQERVAALNLARTALHEVSPFRSEPVDLVLWVPGADVHGYEEYGNPNSVAPPEMRLLEHSILRNGFAIAIITHLGEDGETVVDGIHRRRVGTENEVVRERLHGYLPVSHILAERSDVAGRVVQTVEFNRARGVHGVDAMSALVRLLYQGGWTDAQIQQELGMEIDEVMRLKQITGLAALFADQGFSEAWEVDDSGPRPAGTSRDAGR